MKRELLAMNGFLRVQVGSSVLDTENSDLFQL